METPTPTSPSIFAEPDARAENAHASSLWADAWRRLARNHLAVAGLGFIIVMAALCFAGPFFCHYTYEEQDLKERLLPPGRTHWFGADSLGRDVLVRVLYGGRVSLTVGLVATLVSLTIGVLYGAIAGYMGGKIDDLMMRIVDIIYALPFVIFVILIMVFFADGMRHFLLLHGLAFAGSDLILLFGAIGAVEWLTMARIVRGQVISLKKQEFIEAAVALGLRKRAIILRHIAPNVLGPVIVYATLTVPGVMLLESFLSFLGLGVQPPMSSWGSLIKDGADNMEDATWLLICPGLFFALTLFSLNFLGDGLRDALDVRSSKD
jgi:oligopeptide transport system permease protein